MDIPERIWAIPVKYGSASGKYYTANIVPTNSGYREYILKSVSDKDYNDALREGHDQGYKECYKHNEEAIEAYLKEK